MRIQNITINKFKAFTKEEKIPIGGSNVFIYGENGSGKSSFYYALKDFFQSSVEPIDMASLRNFNLTDGGNDCSIEVEFDGGVKNIVNEITRNTNTPQIIDANRLKSFLTYKHLLGVHNVKVSDELDVFELTINGVLKHFKSSTITNGIELGSLWQDLAKEANKPFGSGKEFYYARQKKASVESKALPFNNALNRLFLTGNPDYLAPDVNKILQKLSPGLTIEFTRHSVTVNQNGYISMPKIVLEVQYNGNSLNTKSPQFSLNEAKLSAIAISIFLGSIVRQRTFSPEIKPLFLDDILIGLDNENRLRLLHLLQEKGVADANKVFKDFQIFITTYDRHWFEVAKLNLTGWKFIEFYKSDNGPQIIHDNRTFLEKATSYYKAFDFPACANYLRKECERLLKDKLPETYTLGDGIKGLIKAPTLDTLIDRLRIYYEDLGVEPPIDLIESLQNYKSILFNPMSHSDIESPIYRNDLDLAFKTIDDLKTISLPTRKVLIDKGAVFNLVLAAINYTAIIEIAKDVYIVESSGAKTISPIIILFKTWIREGVEFASPKGVPAIAITGAERLEKIKESPFTLDKAVHGLNVTYIDRAIAEITGNDLLSALTVAGKTLFDIMDDSKK
ncbi:AAA family ATPase [Mucilaginibacter sp. RB4R14]|uniref:AAA family ATPase n=1 Tax=Mucilaginibacter aurantiaciroseus TaxID=2949308 RepID=UPI0020914733|nr:AAA family ATPase [Mucilaginibacter aurantiaciroseus]MCO5936887.1 AAA family ATPase [Mucilaginibacter aurantiaciroseus]